MERWEWIGQVGKASGLKGLFMVSGRPDLLLRPKGGLRLGKSLENSTPCSLVSYQVKSERAYLQLSLAADRSAIERLYGLSLWQETDNPSTTAIGALVYDSQEGFLGVLEKIENFGASDIATIEHPSLGTLDIPFVWDYFESLAPDADNALHLRLPFSFSHFEGLWLTTKDSV